MKNINTVKIIFIAGLLILASVEAFAKEINFQATVDANKAGLGQPIQLDLTFDNTQNAFPKNWIVCPNQLPDSLEGSPRREQFLCLLPKHSPR